MSSRSNFNFSANDVPSQTRKSKVFTGANAEEIGPKRSKAKDQSEEIACYGQEVNEDVNKVSQSCSKVVLVDIYAPQKTSHKKPVRCYCIIDEQSSRSFRA